MKKNIILIFVGCIGYLNAQSNQTEKKSTVNLSLQEAIQFAETNNPDYKKSKIDVQISKETVNQTIAVGLPQISATGSFNKYLTVPGQYVKNFVPTPGAPEYIMIKFAQPISSSGTINVNQLLFDGSYLIGLQASQKFQDMSKLLESKSKTDLQLNITKAYLMASTTQKNIDVVQANIKTLTKSLNDLKELNKEGFAEKLDVQRLNLALGNLKVQEEKLLNGIKALTNVLKLQMGMDVNTEIVLTDNLEKINESIKIENTQISNFDSKMRIEYKIINQSLMLSQLDKRRYQMGYLPRLVGFYSTGLTTNRPTFNFFESNLPINNSWISSQMIGLQMQLTLFDGLNGASKIREAQLRINKANLDKANFENAANMQFSNSVNAYETQLKQAAIQKENLDLAKQIYETANIKYKEGVGSSLEVMQADSDLKAAQNNYLNAIYDLILSKIDYYQATGKSIN